MKHLIPIIEESPLEYYSVPQCAVFLSKTRDTIYRYIKIGKRVGDDTYVKLSKKEKSRIHKNELINFIKAINEPKKFKPRRYYRAVL